MKWQVLGATCVSWLNEELLGDEPLLLSGLFRKSVLGRLDAFEEVDETIVRDFCSDRLFSSVVHEPFFEKNRGLRFCDEIAVRGKLDITRAIMGFDTFADQRCVLAHNKNCVSGNQAGQWYKGFAGSNGEQLLNREPRRASGGAAQPFRPEARRMPPVSDEGRPLTQGQAAQRGCTPNN
jgi:hypothetical protein